MTLRRNLAVAAALLTLGVTVFLLVGSSPAQPGDASPKPTEAKPLPIGKVILFSSGVGYFQREGEVVGDAKIDLAFPTANINDLLKSLVLQDLGGGQVSTISYDSADPLEKTLKSFALDLTQNLSLANLLQQARGEKVEVVLPPNAATPGSFAGTIIGLETRPVPAGEGKTVDAPFLNVLTARGIQSLRLDQVEKVSFLNPTMEAELKRALETLAKSHDTQKKSVSLSFTGQGKRAVRVGYVIEHPIWKTSYRLVLDKEGKPLLQGWAIVENPTDEDWNGVKVTLVSGRPISFRMDLYDPLYVGRPTVEPELFASLRPPTYDGSMGSKDKALAEQRREFGPPVIKHRTATVDTGGISFGAGVNSDPNVTRRQLGVPVQNATIPVQRGYWDDSGLSRGDNGRGLELGQSVTSAATGQDLGDFFQYAINQPVTLTRKKSAMLPIVNQPIEGTKVSIYNEAVHAKYPLLGLRLKNSTGLHLMQGPITLFEASSYAGDARIMDLVPGEERLLSYAIDLGAEVVAEGKNTPDQITAAKIVKGVMEVTSKQRLTKSYALKNRDDKDRQFIIEHPIRQGLKLVTPAKADEQSRDQYRFTQKVVPGGTAKLEVVEDFDQKSTFQLVSMATEPGLQVYLTNDAISPKVKDALRQAIKFWQAVEEARRATAEADQQLAALRADQLEARENLKALPNTSAAYRRFLEKIDAVQTDIEKVQATLKQHRAEEASKKKEYEGYLNGLTVE